MISKVLRVLISASVAPFRCHVTHLTRHLEYSKLSNFLQESNCRCVASISGSTNLCHVLGLAKEKMVELNYPTYDARNLPFPDGHFDGCVADQVIEHIEGGGEPFVRECARVIKTGGFFVNATVTTHPIHYGPKDLWRFTPLGMSELMESAGFRIVSEGSWGGRAAVIMMVLGLSELKVPMAQWHPVSKLAKQDGADWPVVIWSVGQKK